MLEYYRLTKDFTRAIETADNLIKNYKEDADYVSGVLYAKGLIELYRGRGSCSFCLFFLDNKKINQKNQCCPK